MRAERILEIILTTAHASERYGGAVNGPPKRADALPDRQLIPCHQGSQLTRLRSWLHSEASRSVRLDDEHEQITSVGGRLPDGASVAQINGSRAAFLPRILASR